MKKLLLTVLAAVSCSVAAFAGTADPKEIVREDVLVAYEFMEAAGMAHQFNQMIAMSLAEYEDTPAAKPMREFFNKYLSFESLKADLAKLYLESFSVEEIKQLTAFYQTELGKQVGSQMPVLTQKSMLLGQQRVMEHMDELEEAIRQVMDNSPTKVEEK